MLCDRASEGLVTTTIERRTSERSERSVMETAKYLRAHPGHAFCDDCLADRTGTAPREVRIARVALAGNAEFEQQIAFCSACLAFKLVIHVAWLHFEPAESPSTEFLD